MTEDYGKVAVSILESLLSEGSPKKGEILVVGCSSSEVIGEHIGKSSNEEAGTSIAKALHRATSEKGLYLAAQCCEHLNRALVVEREVANKFNLTIVTVVPHSKAGGAFSTAVYNLLEDPVMVENIQAQWGLDIGLTLIGMHLMPVAIPVRVVPNRIGHAIVTAARTRPKLIGGPRAHYE